MPIATPAANAPTTASTPMECVSSPQTRMNSTAMLSEAAAPPSRFSDSRRTMSTVRGPSVRMAAKMTTTPTAVSANCHPEVESSTVRDTARPSRIQPITSFTIATAITSCPKACFR